MAGHGHLPSLWIVTIDREGPVPPYRQIADQLRARIIDGSIPVGRRLPSMVEMEQEFGVARDTLRKAVQVLKNEGRVETVQGMGVYVIEPPAEPEVNTP